jgi:hypothetical protein
MLPPSAFDRLLKPFLSFTIGVRGSVVDSIVVSPLETLDTLDWMRNRDATFAHCKRRGLAFPRRGIGRED